MRICIHTANMIMRDWLGKTQAAWIQDFPCCTSDSSPSSEFLKDIDEYFLFLQKGGCDISQTRKLLQNYNFADARAKLVVSVPGYHKGRSLYRYVEDLLSIMSAVDLALVLGTCG